MEVKMDRFDKVLDRRHIAKIEAMGLSLKKTTWSKRKAKGRSNEVCIGYYIVVINTHVLIFLSLYLKKQFKCVREDGAVIHVSFVHMISYLTSYIHTLSLSSIFNIAFINAMRSISIY